MPLLNDQRPQVQQLSKTRQVLLGTLMAMTSFAMAANSISSVLHILSIAKDIKASELAVQWGSSAYSLAGACGLLVAGRLADLYGQKYLFLLGASITCVFSIIAGSIRNRIALCVVRALTGLGSSITMPSTFGIVGVTFTQEPGRTIVFCAMGFGNSVGSALGQVFGGLIASTGRHGWQYDFFFLAGLALLCVIMGYIVIPSELPRQQDVNRRIDWLGAAITTLALTLFIFSIVQGGLVQAGWQNAYIPILFSLSILLVILFGVWEHHVKRHRPSPPIVDLTIFSRQKLMVTAILLAHTSRIANSGWVYLTSIWYQDYKHESLIQAVLHVLTAPIAGMGVCMIVPILAPRVPAPVLLIFAGVCTFAACWLYAVEPEGSTYWAFEFPSNIANPLGADFTVGIGYVLISNLAAENEQSTLDALYQIALQLSGTIGVCLSSLIQTLGTAHNESLHQALSDGFWVMAGFAWLSCLIIFATLKRVGLAKDVRNIL